MRKIFKTEKNHLDLPAKKVIKKFFAVQRHINVKCAKRNEENIEKNCNAAVTTPLDTKSKVSLKSSGDKLNINKIINDMENLRTANQNIINNLFNFNSFYEDEKIYSSLLNYMKHNTEINLVFQGKDIQIKRLIELHDNTLFLENLHMNNSKFLRSLYNVDNK